jgi:DNA-binding CsgD family transcriptional regulator
MPKIKTPTPSQELRSFLHMLLDPQKEYNHVVKPEMQAKQLEDLDAIIPNESFYFVFNLQTAEFDQVKGIEQWLGYPGQEFSVNRYLNCIHPSQSVLHNLIARSMYSTLCRGVFRLQFARQKYISQVGLRHYNGEYLVFKKTTSVFQYDTQHRLLAQLNEFTKIDKYDNELLRIRITETDGMQKEKFEREILRKTLEVFMDNKYFSPKEFKVLQAFAGQDALHTRQLAEQLGLQPGTIDTYNKRILAKARSTFTRDFANAREVALYLKKEKIL